MERTTYQWHQRFIQQAQWTQNIRRHLFSYVSIKPSTKLLDVGCGTGVLENEFHALFSIEPYGIDINNHHLRFAQGYTPEGLYLQGDGLKLPFHSKTFDISLCHFYLLWLKEPLHGIIEMIRVTQSNGYVLALAEPDYGGRIDFPDELSKVGEWQADALKDQGANPQIGRQLRYLFHKAGLAEVEVGVLGGEWRDRRTGYEHEQEWDVLSEDLADNVDFHHRAAELKMLDLTAVENNQRILFVPTFYAIGKVTG